MEDVAYAEFDNPRLAKVYDSFNSLGDDETFWLQRISELNIDSIADIGCGTGLLTCKLAELGYDTVGIEPAVPMLQLATQKEYADRVTWKLGSTEQLTDDTFDLVLMTSHVAQFMVDDESWQRALRNMYNSLHVGGYIFFDSKNSENTPWKYWSRETTSKNKLTTEGTVEYWIESPVEEENCVTYELHYNFERDDATLISRNTLIYRTKDEIVKDLETAGFVLKYIYGNWDGSEVQKDSPEMIFLAKK